MTMTPFCCNRSRFLLPPAIEFATTGSSKKTPWGVVCHGWLQLRRGRVRRGRQSSDACEVGVAVVAPRRPGCSISRGHPLLGRRRDGMVTAQSHGELRAGRGGWCCEAVTGAPSTVDGGSKRQDEVEDVVWKTPRGRRHNLGRPFSI